MPLSTLHCPDKDLLLLGILELAFKGWAGVDAIAVGLPGGPARGLSLEVRSDFSGERGGCLVLRCGPELGAMLAAGALPGTGRENASALDALAELGSLVGKQFAGALRESEGARVSASLPYHCTPHAWPARPPDCAVAMLAGGAPFEARVWLERRGPRLELRP